jgi:hypothetical protein
MRKAMLMIPVYYDEDKTDGEALASAFDTLLETVMSTPGILDEYANPDVGEFSLEFDTHWPEEPGDVQYLVKLGPVDGALFAQQRLAVLFGAEICEPPLWHATKLADPRQVLAAAELFEGLTNMLDVIADQLHNRYGIPCLLEEPNGEEEEEEEACGAAGSDDGGHALTPDDVDEPTDPG